MTLTLDNVAVSVGSQRILTPLTAEVSTGGFTAIVGPNGAGKSTILRAIAGIQEGQRGQVKVDSQVLSSLSLSQRAALVGWLPQRIRPTEPVDVCTWLAAARYRFGAAPSAHADAVRGCLQDMNLEHLADRSLTTLSGGELQRVSLAALAVQEAQVWLLDEPANHLDPLQQQRVYRFLARQRARGTTMVCVTHDLNLLHHLGDPRLTVWVMREGTRIGAYTLDDPALVEALQQAFEVPVQRLQHGGRVWWMVGGAA